jgi:chemotaxis protein histidine kinase CheA
VPQNGQIDFQALIQIFVGEAEEQLAGMDQALAALARQPDDQDSIKTMFLLAHTLKGSAATVGLEEVTLLARGLKDVADALRRQAIGVSPELLAACREMVETIRRTEPLPTGRLSGGPPADHSALLARLAAVGAEKPPGGSGSLRIGNKLADESVRRLK